MKLEITPFGIDLTPNLLNHIKQRVKFRFREFSDLGLYVSVTLFQSNHPRGIENYCVHIYTSTPNLERTVVREEWSDLYQAINIAIYRTEHALSMKPSQSTPQNRYLSPSSRGLAVDSFSGPAFFATHESRSLSD